ncbi:MAG: regulatory protein RecX [Bacillota bacterium]|nr:regulatory protein RecX [Bacillota bacterium]
MLYIEKITYTLGGKATIFLSNEERLSISAADVGALNISVESEISESQLKAIRKMALEYSAREKALRSLSQTDFSERSLSKRLKEKGVDESVAQKTVRELAEKGYVNDQVYAERLARVYGIEKHFGPRRVISELISRGIDYNLAREVSEKVLTDLSENIKALYNMRFARYDLTDIRQKKKVSDALVRYGYGFEEIRSLFSDLRIIQEDE